MSVNKIFIIGNLGADPTVRELQNGEIVSFRVATSERGYTNSAGVQVPERVDWHSCVAFGKTAQYVKNYVRKGMTVYIEGKVRYNKWTDNSGAEKWSTEIVVDRLDNLTPKSDNQQGGYQQPPMPQAQPQGFAPAPPPSANDIPGYGQQDDRLPF